MTARVVPARRMVLEAPQPQLDGAGGFAVQWLPVAVHWAELRGGAGRNRSGAEEVPLGVTPWRVLLRAVPEAHPARPRPGLRFRDGMRVLRILAVSDHDPRGGWLVCHAQEEVPA